MPDDRPLVSYADLIVLLNRDGVMHQARAEAREVIIPTKKGELDSMLILRWRETDGIVEFIQMLPMEFPAARLSAIESAACRLNYGIAIGSFVVAHETRRVAFRSTLALLPRGNVIPPEVRAYFSLTVNLAAEWLPAFKHVADGTLAPENILAQTSGQGSPAPDALTAFGS